MIKPYTVILLRPDYIADHSVCADTFTAWEAAETPQGSIDLARRVACQVDAVPEDQAMDYALIACFEGIHNHMGGE